MIEQVVGGCANCELESFSELEVLEDGEIGVKEVGPTGLISLLIAKSSWVRGQSCW